MPPSRRCAGPQSAARPRCSLASTARATSMLMLIETAKLNGIDPQAWLADALRRIADHPVSRLNQLLAGIGKTAPIKLLLLDRLSRRGTQRMPTPVQRLGRLHPLLFR